MRSLVLAVTVVLAGSPVVVLAQAPATSGPGQPVARIERGPGVGDQAPEFRLPWASKDSIGTVSEDFVLRRQQGKTVVLAFYPADFSSGCTAELKAFTDRYDELFGEGVVVVGISPDSVETHQRFAASLGAPFKLLSDPTQRVAKQYGSDGEHYPHRTVYVLNGDGRVVYRDLRFGALDPTSYDKLKAAVLQARR